MTRCLVPDCKKPIHRTPVGDWSSFAIEGKPFHACSLHCAWSLITGELAKVRLVEEQHDANRQTVTLPLWSSPNAA
jgi:hypothetical protein